MLYELILINEIEQRAKIIFLSVEERPLTLVKFIVITVSIFEQTKEHPFSSWSRLCLTVCVLY